MLKAIVATGACLGLLFAPPSTFAQEGVLALADEAWARRAEGHADYRAAPGPITVAVDGYEAALREEPSSLEARWKLLRALQFMGQFAANGRERRREVFGRGREVFESGLDLLAERVGGRKRLDKLEPQEMRERFGDTPDVVPVYLYGAINTGLWASAFGAMAALRQGVAGRVRRYAEIVIALDPEYQGGAGQRFLAGLHANAPRVPFVTGWVRRETAIALLRQALLIDPEHRGTRMSLAETLLRYAPGQRPEALAILAELAELEPRPDALLETLTLQRNARALLTGS